MAAQYTVTMPSGDPIRVFVCHDWQEHDDYLRVFEYLESARGFVYSNCSDPAWRAPATAGNEIGRSEAVVALTSMLDHHYEQLKFQMTCAKAMDKPVLLLPRFGQAGAIPAAFKGLWDEQVGWDERALVDALRRQARHQESTRWDTIEFKMD
jgi:hypothetical protein